MSPARRLPDPAHRMPRAACAGRALAFAAGLVVWLAVAGCAPALDWRELRPEGAHVRASMPCRPASHQRELPLAGAPVPLSLWACQVEAGTFALAVAELGDPARVGPALLAMREAARQNLQGRVIELAPAQVPGMTPNTEARRWRLEGQLPDGRAVQSQGQVFAHGTRVYQATVLGAALDDAAVRSFFDGLAVLP